MEFLKDREQVRELYASIEKEIENYFNSLQGLDNLARYKHGKLTVAALTFLVPTGTTQLSKLGKLKEVLRILKSYTRSQFDEFLPKFRRFMDEGLVSGIGRPIAKSGAELRTYLDGLVTLPAGKTYNGKLYKSVSKNAELSHNAKPGIISEFSVEEAWGRYDMQGESSMYYSKTLTGNQTEMSNYGDWNSYSTYEFANVEIDNMLDLTDDTVIKLLGTEFNKLVLTKGTKAEMYEFTNVIGTWARSKGYKGLIVPGARGAQDYTNIVIFNQSDLTTALNSIIPIKLK